MAKKKSVTIPKNATIKCPHCEKSFRTNLPEDSIVNSLECKKCKTLIQSPRTKCCVICAFSNKQCSASAIMEAKMKNLEIRMG